MTREKHMLHFGQHVQFLSSEMFPGQNSLTTIYSA